MNKTISGEQEPDFTPGEWVSAAEVQQFDLGESFDILGGPDRQLRIATVLNFDDYPCLEEELAEEMDIEAQANGRLIAAAPALYRVVKCLVAIHDTITDTQAHEWEEEKLVVAARAALALVTGPQVEDGKSTPAPEAEKET